MKSTTSRYNTYRGMTLIETVIYTTMLSMLMSSFVASAWEIHVRDLRLFDEVMRSYEL